VKQTQSESAPTLTCCISYQATIESQSGIVLPRNGCVLLFDSNTLPDKTSLLILAGLSECEVAAKVVFSGLTLPSVLAAGVCFQAFSTLLAIFKLYQRPDPDNIDGLPQSIYTALMVDGEDD
jgi:hypothetical protein